MGELSTDQCDECAGLPATGAERPSAISTPHVCRVMAPTHDATPGTDSASCHATARTPLTPFHVVSSAARWNAVTLSANHSVGASLFVSTRQVLTMRSQSPRISPLASCASQSGRYLQLVTTGLRPVRPSRPSVHVRHCRCWAHMRPAYAKRTQWAGSSTRLRQPESRGCRRRIRVRSCTIDRARRGDTLRRTCRSHNGTGCGRQPTPCRQGRSSCRFDIRLAGMRFERVLLA